MSWKSWLPRIAGYGLAPFTGGASIPIGEGISQAVGNNEAIDQANAQQNAATDKATAEQQRATGIASDVYDTQRADLAPYRDMGGQAFTTLGGLMGFSPSATAPSTAPPARTATTTIPPMVAATDGSERHPTANGELTGTYAGPRTLNDIQQVASTQRQSGYGGGAQAKVKANGRFYVIPRERLEEALANGGEEVA